MQVIEYPKREEWSALVQRPVLEQHSLEKKIRKLLSKVKEGGDKTVKKYTR